MALTSATMDEIIERVNCYGVGTWLALVLADIGLAAPAHGGSFVTLPRSAGLLLKIEFLESALQSSDPADAFYISLAEGNELVPPPRGLERTDETIDTARAKLSPSIVGGSPSELAAGDRRVSYFMAGGRVVELRFNSSLVGFDRILIARLGEPRDWRIVSAR